MMSLWFVVHWKADHAPPDSAALGKRLGSETLVKWIRCNQKYLAKYDTGERSQERVQAGIKGHSIETLRIQEPEIFGKAKCFETSNDKTTTTTTTWAQILRLWEKIRFRDWLSHLSLAASKWPPLQGESSLRVRKKICTAKLSTAS